MIPRRPSTKCTNEKAFRICSSVTLQYADMHATTRLEYCTGVLIRVLRTVQTKFDGRRQTIIS
jgi:hypothetical protein